MLSVTMGGNHLSDDTCMKMLRTLESTAKEGKGKGKGKGSRNAPHHQEHGKGG